MSKILRKQGGQRSRHTRNGGGRMKRGGGVPIVVLGLLAAIIAWGGSVPGHAQTGDSNALGASLPGPVPGTADARTTALLLLCFVPATCHTDPCFGTVPTALRLAQKANP